MGVKDHPASDEVVAWLQGISGMLTRVNADYGSFTDLIEHPEDVSNFCKVVPLDGVRCAA